MDGWDLMASEEEGGWKIGLEANWQAVTEGFRAVDLHLTNKDRS